MDTGDAKPLCAPTCVLISDCLWNGDSFVLIAQQRELCGAVSSSRALVQKYTARSLESCSCFLTSRTVPVIWRGTASPLKPDLRELHSNLGYLSSRCQTCELFSNSESNADIWFHRGFSVCILAWALFFCSVSGSQAQKSFFICQESPCDAPWRGSGPARCWHKF